MKLLSFTKTYGDRRVLDFPGLRLEPGKIYAVIGANGSGKSTFARILAGVLNADRRGRVTEGSVGYLPQKNYAFRMSTLQNLLTVQRDEDKARGLLEKLQLSALADKRADRLSGGETARMALARLIMQRFDLVILDEPTAAMDMETTALSENAIRDYVRSTGCALILITHSIQQARRLAEEVLYFHKGRLMERGLTEEVLNHPQQPETAQFLDFYGIRDVGIKAR